jgi:hypothetical protein
VYLLVDRSSSMFMAATLGGPTAWPAIKTPLLQTVQTFQDQIRFGFSAYTGVVGTTCPLDLTSVSTMSLDNYAAINAVYGPLGGTPAKSESPTAYALASLRPTLIAATGAKYLFLITDGGQDFCNDTDPVCADDAVVNELQLLEAAGIETHLFGVSPGSTFLTVAELQSFANAGAGAAVVSGSTNLASRCAGVSEWAALSKSYGRAAGQALGTYQTMGGATPAVSLDPSDPTAIETSLLRSTSTLKSCVFDLRSGSVNLSKLGEASVLIDGEPVPQDGTGWQMNSATELDLVGQACTRWRDPATGGISFDFPCDVFQ